MSHGSWLQIPSAAKLTYKMNSNVAVFSKSFTKAVWQYLQNSQVPSFHWFTTVSSLELLLWIMSLIQLFSACVYVHDCWHSLEFSWSFLPMQSPLLLLYILFSPPVELFNTSFPLLASWLSSLTTPFTLLPLLTLRSQLNLLMGSCSISCTAKYRHSLTCLFCILFSFNEICKYVFVVFLGLYLPL